MVQWLRLCFPMQGVWVQCLVRGLRSHLPRGQKNKTGNRNGIVTNSIKAIVTKFNKQFKTAHIKKKIFKKKERRLM